MESNLWRVQKFILQEFVFEMSDWDNLMFLLAYEYNFKYYLHLHF